MIRFDKDNKRIYIPKGDSGSLTVSLKDSSGSPYSMETGDKLIFTVKNTTDASENLIQIISQTASIYISNEDSNIPVGQYSCDIELVHANGDHDTVFPDYGEDRYLKANQNWKNFWVTPEVGTYGS